MSLDKNFFEDFLENILSVFAKKSSKKFLRFRSVSRFHGEVVVSEAGLISFSHSKNLTHFFIMRLLLHSTRTSHFMFA